ncbi:MAG: hypothetical protein HZB38_02935 [Planctomycetes bacterium]|nr:hypothetical protein [Planctomycetota bacterium]
MTPPTRSLKAGALYVLLGNGAFNLCRLTAVVLLAKTASAEILGQFETGLAIAAPVSVFCCLELRAAYVADARGRAPYSAFRRWRDLGLLVAALSLLAVAVVRLAHDPLVMVLLMAGAFAMRLILQSAELGWGVFQRIERLEWLGLSNLLRGGVMLLAFGGFLGLGRGLGLAVEPSQLAVAAAWTTAAGWLLVSLCYDRPRSRAESDPSELAAAPSGLGNVLRDSLPLAAVALMISLCDALPRLVVRGQDQGARSLGHFGALSYIPMIAHFVMLQIGLAASRRLAVAHETDPARFRRLAIRLTGIAFGLGGSMVILISLLGRTLLSALYRPEYAEHFVALRTLAIAQAILLLASIWGFLLTQMRWFWVQVPIHVAVMAVTSLAAWSLIPDNPIEGASQTALIRAIVHCALYGAALFVASRLGTTRITA